MVNSSKSFLTNLKNTMQQKALKTIVDMPEEIFENYLFKYLLEKDLFLLSTVSRKFRLLVIKNVFKNNSSDRYENLIDQYLSYWLMNFSFIGANEALYQTVLVAYSQSKPKNHFQKIKAYYLLHTLYCDETVHQTYYSRLLSLLEAHCHQLTTDLIKEITTIQGTSDLAAATDFSEKFKLFLLDNNIPFEEKLFFMNSFKYWDNRLVLTRLNQLKSYALEHISDSDPKLRIKAVIILGILTTTINFETKNQFIHLLIKHSLFDREFWLRHMTFHTLCSLVEHLADDKLIPIVDKLIDELDNPNIIDQRKEYTVKFLGSIHLRLLDVQAKNLIGFLICQARRKDEYNYNVRKASVKTLILFLTALSERQLLTMIRIFYELLADTGMPDKIVELAHEGLVSVGQTCSSIKVSQLVESFSQKTYPDNAIDAVSYLQALSYLGQYVTDGKLMTCLESLFIYLVDDNSYINDRAYHALKTLLKNLSDSQVTLTLDSLLEKLHHSDSAIRTMSLKALALFAARIPDESIQNVSVAIRRQIDHQDFAVSEMAIYALQALAIHKKMIINDEIISQLFQKMNSSNLDVYEAAAQTLVAFVPFIAEKKVKDSLIFILLSHLKNKNEEIQIIALNAISPLWNFVTPENFNTVIRPILLSHLEHKTNYTYAYTLSIIQSFNPYILSRQPQEFVVLLVKNMADRNHDRFFQKILTTLSLFYPYIGKEQEILLKAATTFKISNSLSKKEQRLLKQKILQADEFWEKLYTAQFKQAIQTETDRYNQSSNQQTTSSTVLGTFVASSFNSPISQPQPAYQVYERFNKDKEELADDDKVTARYKFDMVAYKRHGN